MQCRDRNALSSVRPVVSRYYKWENRVAPKTQKRKKCSARKKKPLVDVAAPLINDKQPEARATRNDRKMRVRGCACEISAPVLPISGRSQTRPCFQIGFRRRPRAPRTPDGRKRAEISSVGSRPCLEIKRTREIVPARLCSRRTVDRSASLLLLMSRLIATVIIVRFYGDR